MRILGLVTAAAMALFSAPALADVVTLEQNNSRVMRLDQQASTVVVGNPMIAEAMVVNGNLLVLQGRLFGSTDVIALNANGDVVADYSITVGAPQQMQVSLFRGPESYTYACPGECVEVHQPGDAPEQTDVIFRQNREVQNLSSWPFSLETADEE